MKKIDIHLHAALDPVPGTEKFKISTGEEMLAHLEELQIEKAIVMSSGETEGAMASVSGNQPRLSIYYHLPSSKCFQYDG